MTFGIRPETDGASGPRNAAGLMPPFLFGSDQLEGCISDRLSGSKSGPETRDKAN
jgi:hypothetical protein